jgi:hypothetical protein
VEHPRPRAGGVTNRRNHSSATNYIFIKLEKQKGITMDRKDNVNAKEQLKAEIDASTARIVEAYFAAIGGVDGPGVVRLRDLLRDRLTQAINKIVDVGPSGEPRTRIWNTSD